MVFHFSSNDLAGFTRGEFADYALFGVFFATQENAVRRRKKTRVPLYEGERTLDDNGGSRGGGELRVRSLYPRIRLKLKALWTAK